MKRLSGSIFLTLLVSTSFLPAVCQPKTLWEIGKYDQSAEEFKAAQSDHVVYQIGKSDWARDWPRWQRTGSTYEIQFNLDAAPQGAYLLKISLVTGYLGTPDMQVEINGHKGIYYVRSKPIYTANSALLSIELPTKYMAKGENSVILSPVNAQVANAGSDAAVESIRYDFIGMTNDPHAKHSQGDLGAEVVPTVFYQQKEGKLVELVDAYLRFGQKNPIGSAVLTLNGKSYNTEVAARNDFGEERVEFEVSEWQGTATATLNVTAGMQRNFNLPLTAERKWTLFIVPHTHVDIGYTDYQGKVAENQAETLVEAADLIKKYPDFRFATDGSWNLQQLMETRPQLERDEILGLIRSHKIGVPADYFNLLTGYASLETLYRSLYYTKRLAREYNLPFDYASTTDVPSYTGAYPSVLASAGVKYWAVGANQDRAPVLTHELWNEKSPFWWEGPDGKKVLFWYSWGYAQIGRFFTLNPTNELIHEALPQLFASYDRPAYKPDAVLMYGAQDENTDLHSQLATFATAWDQSYAYPKLQYSTFADFFNYVDQRFGAQLPTRKGDMGPYWEDGIGSDSSFATVDRQNQSDALSSEIVSTVAHVMNPMFHQPKAETEDAWNNILLFAEHTWGAGNSISQPDSSEAVKQLAAKDNYATQAHFELEDITNRSLYQLAHQIQVPGRTIVVFNGLNWKRDALIETDLRKVEELVDLTTHQKVPVEVLSDRENFFHVRFLASDLPSVGYKCFQVRTASNPVATASSPESSPVIENKYYRITIDAQSGAIQSIFDKELQRELVDRASPYRFGQYLYVTGGDPKGNGQTQMIHPTKTLPVAQLEVHPATKGEYLGALKTAWGYSIKLRSSDVNTPAIVLELLLFDNEKKMELRYTVEKSYTTAKEAVYFAFPAAVESPRFEYATQQGWVDPSRDMLKGASLEWFSVQKWMAVHNSHLAVDIVPVDASLASFGDINRGEWPEEFHPKTSTIFSYAMNNYWHTNYRAGQGGTFTFRYVMTSADHLDPVALTRLGSESMEAPAIDMVASQDKVGNPDEPLPAEGTSFLEINAPNIALVTWKLAEDSKGTILRLQETAGQVSEVTVQLPHTKIHSANLCNSVEDNLRDLDVAGNLIHLTMQPHEVLTIRLTP
jgi:alpha-mannosidase